VFQYLKYIAIKSITFIQKLGYTLVGKIPGFYRSDVDEYLMMKRRKV
jgi:hypothetical protein